MGWFSTQRARLATHILPRRKFLTDRTRKHDVESLLGSIRPVVTPRPLRRLGPSGDGGYLVPDDLSGIEACFSPGVSTVSGFELECARMGMRVFLADASVDEPPISHENFEFRGVYVGANTRGDFVTLENWVKGSGCSSTGDLLLQMDIEGFEYQTLLAAPAELIARFRVMVVEFHSLEQLWNKPFFGLVEAVFDKVLETHVCVHLHPNNYYPLFTLEGLAIPPLLEVTFLRRDRLPEHNNWAPLPHPLDCDNTARPPIEVPGYWLRAD